jgi:hypothetical protein
MGSAGEGPWECLGVYRYEPPRALEVITAEIKVLEGEILDLLKEVTA